MKRDPSLHLRESQLIILLREVLRNRLKLSSCTPERIVGEILNKAKTKSCSSRSIISSNDKTEKKIEKIKLTGRSETSLFAEILTLIRRKFHHKGIQRAIPGTSAWLDIKSICRLATDFCNEFELPLKEGYTEYLRIGMIRMKNFSLNKFNTMHSIICKVYECVQVIERDRTPAETHKLYITYMATINDKVGYDGIDYRKMPEKYVGFVYAKKLAKRMGISYSNFIKAQFHALEFFNGIPDPLQLYGDKAIERVGKYCYENSINLKKNKSVDFKNIRYGN